MHIFIYTYLHAKARERKRERERAKNETKFECEKAQHFVTSFLLLDFALTICLLRRSLIGLFEAWLAQFLLLNFRFHYY